MQGSFCNVVSQAAFPDTAGPQHQHGEAYSHLFSAVPGSVQSEDTTTPSIIQLGNSSYSGPTSLSNISGLPSVSGIAQSQLSGQSVSAIPLQPLPHLSSTGLGAQALPSLSQLPGLSGISNMWSTGVHQGVPSTISSFQSGLSCYPYLSNSVVSGLPSTTFMTSSYTFSQPNSSLETYSTQSDTAEKTDTHKRLSASEWRTLVDMYKEETPIKALMNKFGVSRSQVYRIIRLKGIKPNNRDEQKKLGRPKGLSEKEMMQIREMCKNKNKSLTRMLDELIASGILTRVISVSTLSRILRSSKSGE